MRSCSAAHLHVDVVVVELDAVRQRNMFVAASRAQNAPQKTPSGGFVTGFTICRCKQSPIGDRRFENSNGKSTPKIMRSRSSISHDPVHFDDGEIVSAGADESPLQN